MTRIAAVLLAAGAGSRFRASAEQAGIAVSHKLLAPLAHRTVVEHAYAAMTDGAPPDSPRIVVSGAVALPELAHATVVVNLRWNEGQAGSLWTALRAAGDAGCEGVVVGLGDQPFVSASDWAAVFAAAADGAEIGVATYDSKRRNPVFLRSSVWPLIPTVGDEGARSVLAAHPDLVVEVPCVGSPADIDTAADLLRWS